MSDFPFSLPLLLDGSTGTALMRRGMPEGVSTELWVLEHPDVLADIQRGYVEAGSRVLFTPTFGATRPMLSRHGFDGDVAALNRRLASLTVKTAREYRDAGTDVFVAADIGPAGLMLEPVGDVSFDDAVSVYDEQVRGLLEAGVDLFGCETHISLAEVRAAVTAIRARTDKPVFVSMTVDGNGRTMNGDTLPACLLSLYDLGISAFGLNCSFGPKAMASPLAAAAPYAAALGVPLIAKANAGLPGEGSFTPEEYAACVPALLDAGASILGGCCGTDDKTIAAIASVLAREPLRTVAPAALDLGRTAASARAVIEIPADAEVVDPDDAYDCDDYVLTKLTSADDVETLLEDAAVLPPIAVTADSDPAAVALLKRGYAGRVAVI